MIYEAVKMALDDAQMEPKDIDAILIGNMDHFEGINFSEMWCGIDAAPGYLKPVLKIATGGTTGSSRGICGYYNIASGIYKNILVVGWEKLNEGGATTGIITAFDAVLMGRRPHINWGVSKKDLEIVDAALRRLGLESLAMRYIDEMSGGELQKVAIARALVQEPKLILLDEPTSNLDLKNQVEVLGIIRRIVNEHTVAAVMTMHDLNAAFRYADKCIFIKNGKIFYAGSTQSVNAEIIETVYGLPVNIYKQDECLIVIPQAQ